jgi:protein O-mannosyl-transferase
MRSRPRSHNREGEYNSAGSSSPIAHPPVKSRRRKAPDTAIRKENAAQRSMRLGPASQAALLALVVFLVAIPTLANHFVSLDDLLYLGNRSVTGGLTSAGVIFAFTTVSTLYWHPLAWLSHELDVELFGMNAAGHHFDSVLLHSISAGLLFLVLRRFGAGRWSAAAAALLWALHPLRVESFAWTAERKDVLCAVFFIATILAYLRYAERPSRGRYAAWTCLAALALMSKPTAVSLAPALLLLDYWPLRRTCGILQLLKEKLPLLGMTAAVMFLTVYGQRTSGSMSHLANVPFLIRLENAPVSYVRYIGKMLWPVNLSCFYAYDSHPATAWVAASALVLCTITIVAVLQRDRRPWLLAGWLWFLVALLPNIGLLQAGRQSIADRFTHLAMIGVAVAVVFTVADWTGTSPFRRKAAGILTCCTLAVLAVLTWRQVAFWHDSVRLFDHAISVEDGHYVRGVLAATLIAEHRYWEAEPHLMAALRLAPDRSEHHNNLANVLMLTGRLGPAAGEAATALRLAPNDIHAVETMGAILLRGVDYNGALQQFVHAVQLGADPIPLAAQLNDMGASLASRGQPREAEQLIRGAVELNPSLVQARRNLVLVLEDQGRRAEAARALREAIQATGRQPQYEDLQLSK